jgi:uncharacterized protein YjdB
MKKIFYLFPKSLLSKLALVAILVIGGGNSAWADELTVYTQTSSTTVNTYNPIAGNNVKDYFVKSEILYLSSDISNIVGKNITKLTYETNQETVTWEGAEFKVFLKETDVASYPSPKYDFIGDEDATVVYSGSLSVASNKLEISFSTPFQYNSGNLVVGVYCTKKASNNSTAQFKGLSNYGAYLCLYDASGTTQRNATRPQTTFTYETAGGDPVEVTAPTSLTASNITPVSADLSWTNGGEESTWQLSYSTTTGDHSTTTSDFTDKPHTLSGLTPSTTYYVSIRAKKSGTYSDWSTETSFTTAAAIDVTSVTVSPTSWTMLAGETKTLTATVAPDDATYKTVTWESSDNDVATISSTGVVTAKAPGSATITVKSTADATKQATCDITVTAPVTPTAFKTKELTSNYTYLTWTNGSSETKWKIKYGTTSGDLSNESGDITNSNKPYLITGLTSNTTYYASIRSKLGTAYSEWSEEISFTTPAVGPAPGGAVEVTEDFESGWPVNGSSNLTGVKEGWGNISAYSNYKLSATYRHGESGYGLSMEGYNGSYYLITPAVKAGTTITFWSCRAYGSMTGYVNLYKAIKVGSTYYVNTSDNYASVSHSTGDPMTETTSSTITEGGYVAIHLNRAAIDDITYTAAPTVSAITDNNGFTTFASSSMLDLTKANLPTGLEAYKAARIDGNWVKFTELDQNVPANTGILLKGEPYTEYRIGVASTSTDVEDNEFLVNETGYTFAATNGYSYYGMKKNSYPLTFALFDPSSVAIPSNKAYLKVENVNGASPQLVCAFSDNTTTAIAEIANRQNGQNSYFNLAGQRVDGSRFAVNGSGLKPGLYIINGKKMVIK